MNFSKKITRVLGVLAVVFVCITAVSQKKVNSVHGQTALANKYLHQLHQEERQIWQKLNKFGITQTQLNNTVNNSHRLNKSIKQTVKLPIKNKVHSILRKLNINPEQLSILPYGGTSAAAYSDNVLYINETQFMKQSVPAQEFAVGHEIRHMVYKDDIIIPMLESLLDKSNKNAQSILNEYARFTEKRADITTVLSNPDFAHGYIIFFNDALKQKGDNAGITHPKNSVRLAQAHTIFNEINGVSV